MKSMKIFKFFSGVLAFVLFSVATLPALAYEIQDVTASSENGIHSNIEEEARKMTGNQTEFSVIASHKL